MDGTYQNEYVERIIDFAQNYITDENPIDDLHIDEVDIAFADRKNWLNASFTIFQSLKNCIENTPYDVVLAIPLILSNKSMSIPEKLAVNILDETPPSFYLFKKENCTIKDTIQTAYYDNELSQHFDCKIYYSETAELNAGQLMYNRCLWITR